MKSATSCKAKWQAEKETGGEDSAAEKKISRIINSRLNRLNGRAIMAKLPKSDMEESRKLRRRPGMLNEKLDGTSGQ